MVRINLLPYRAQKRQQAQRLFTMHIAIVIVVVTGIAGLIDYVMTNQLSQHIAINQRLSSENQLLQKAGQEIANLQQSINTLATTQATIQQLQTSRHQAANLLQDLARLVPAGMYLKSLKQQDGLVTLNGLALSNDPIAELMRNIDKQSPVLYTAKLHQIRAAPPQDQRAFTPLFAFTVSLRLVSDHNTMDAIDLENDAASFDENDEDVIDNSDDTDDQNRDESASQPD